MLPCEEEKTVRSVLWILRGSEMVTANLQMAVSSVDCRSLCWLAVYYMQLGILLNGEAGHRGQAVRTQVPMGGFPIACYSPPGPH